MMAQHKYNDPTTFDTLSYAKKLQAVGFTSEQAEVQAETFLSIVQEQLVSKRDFKELDIKIENVKKDLSIEIANVKKDLSIEIENVRLEIANVKKDLSIEIADVKKDLSVTTELLRRDLKIWFGGMLVVAVSALSGMMTLIVHLAR